MRTRATAAAGPDLTPDGGGPGIGAIPVVGAAVACGAPLRAPAVGGQPCTANPISTPRASPGSASTAWSRAGLSLRCAESGTPQREAFALPALLDAAGMVDHAGIGGEIVERLAAQVGRQAVDLEREDCPVDASPAPWRSMRAAAARPVPARTRRHARRCSIRPGWQGGNCPTAGCRPPCRPASRPAAGRRATVPRKSGATATVTGSSTVAVVTVVDQRADRQPLRRRPIDRPGLDAGRQGPLERRRKPGVAGVLPVGVPVRRVADQKAERERLAGSDAFRRVGDQLRADLVGLHHRTLAEREAGGEEERPEPALQRGHRPLEV